ncbi:MAG TPA: hypothetical protein VFT06_00040 [Flavisolibacter sp.]|nr:hypothetical protein [Flavisolibacter sp.]
MNKLIFFLLLSLLCINGVLFWQNSRKESRLSQRHCSLQLAEKRTGTTSGVVLPATLLNIN